MSMSDPACQQLPMSDIRTFDDDTLKIYRSTVHQEIQPVSAALPQPHASVQKNPHLETGLKRLYGATTFNAKRLHCSTSHLSIGYAAALVKDVDDGVWKELASPDETIHFLSNAVKSVNRHLMFLSCIGDNVILDRQTAMDTVATDFVPVAATSAYRTARPASGLVGDEEKAIVKLVPPNNHTDPESQQPPGFARFPLRPEQLRSLGWMLSRERNTSRFKCSRITQHRASYIAKKKSGEFTLHNRSNDFSAPLNFTVDVKVEAEYPSRGGILADELGYGKTAIALGLIAFDTPESAQQELDSIMSPADKISYFSAPNTLILVPSNLLCQWVEQIAKFYLPLETTIEEEIRWRKKARSAGTNRGDFGCPKSVICFADVVNLKMITPEEMAKYDIILCTTRIVFSPLYAARCLCLEKIAEQIPEARTRSWRSQARNSNKILAATKLHHASLRTHTFPVLEQFFWRRIIYDEAHEMHTVMIDIKSQFRWGLTGSPRLNTNSGLHLMAQIMHVDICTVYEANNSFVQEFIRKNTETSYAPIPLEEHVIRVALQPVERALYLAHRQAYPTDTAELIQLCSHFSGNVLYANVMSCFDRVRTERRELLDHRTDLLQGLLSLCSWLSEAGSVGNPRWITTFSKVVEKILPEGAKQNLSRFISDAQAQLHMEKANLPIMPPCTDKFSFLDRSSGGWNQWRDLSKKHKSLLLTHFCKGIEAAVPEYCEALWGLNFMETLFSLVQKSSARSCSICLVDDLELGRIAVAPCSHVFCLECMQLIAATKYCRVCSYTPLTIEKFVTLKPNELESFVIDKPFEEFGSKIYAVYQHLLKIRNEDATAKVIIFTQYSSLLQKYVDVLAKFSIPFLFLKGTTATRGKIIDSFQNDANSTAWILLMDLATSASGAHITAANHVVFIHPMVADSAETAAAYEKQAIGRCQRYGQTKVVKVWRFVAANTIEEDITQLHQTMISQSDTNPIPPAENTTCVVKQSPAISQFAVNCSED